MRVLVVEDDENKRQQLVRFLLHKDHTMPITQMRSYQSGLREILTRQFDRILLDMSMPTYDKSENETGGRFRPFAGREIMEQMDRRGLRTPVIVVTQFESFGEGASRMALHELEERLKADFPAIFWGTVYYNPALNTWADSLTRLLSNISATDTQS